MNHGTHESMHQLILPTSSSKSAPIPSGFCDFELATVSRRFCLLHLPKVARPLSFCDFEMQSKFIEMQIELSHLIF